MDIVKWNTDYMLGTPGQPFISYRGILAGLSLPAQEWTYRGYEAGEPHWCGGSGAPTAADQPTTSYDSEPELSLKWQQDAWWNKDI